MIEPSLNVLGRQAQNVSKGKLQKSTIVPTVALGVATGTVVGIFKLLAGIDLLYLLIPAYALALIQSYGQDDMLVGIAWDAAGVGAAGKNEFFIG